jgi:COMPASS component SWD1
LQAEKVRKPLKSSGRLTKVKSKSVIHQDNGNGFLGDDVSD